MRKSKSASVLIGNWQQQVAVQYRFAPSLAQATSDSFKMRTN